MGGPGDDAVHLVHNLTVNLSEVNKIHDVIIIKTHNVIHTDDT